MTPPAPDIPEHSGRELVQIQADGLGDRMFARYGGERLLERRWGERWLRLPLAQALPPGDDVRVRLKVHQDPVVPAESLHRSLQPSLARMRAHPHRHDGTLTALLSLQADEEGFVGAVAPVSYFHARCTEQLLDASLDLRGQDQRVAGHLPDFSASMLACDIGVVVILETSDGATVVQRRGRHLDWRGGLLSASASGSLEPGRDFSGEWVALDGLVAGARRELAEEVGVGGALDPQAHRLRMWSLGLWRELARGGKPELYTAARTPLTFDEVVALQAHAPDAHESVQVTAMSRADVQALLDEVCARPTIDGLDLALVAGLLLRASHLSRGSASE